MAFTSVDPVFAAAIPQLSATYVLVAIPSAIAGSGRASWVATRSANRPSRAISSAKPPRSTTLPWSNTRFSSASRTVDRRCAMMNVVRPATGSSAPARPAPRSPHPARQSLRPGSESADPSAVNCVVVPQSHMITSFPVRETHNPPTAPSGSRFPLGTAMPARRRRWLGLGRFRARHDSSSCLFAIALFIRRPTLPRIDLDQGNYWHSRLMVPMRCRSNGSEGG